MKAVICEKYGGPEVVKVVDIRKPVPKDDEVSVKIYSASVSMGDVRIRSLTVPNGMKLLMRLVMGFKGPRTKILGGQFAGIVENVGANVDKFKVGDRVYGITGMKFGCHAEYTCVSQNSVISKMPDNIFFDQAVPIPFGAMTALHLLQGKISKGQDVLVYGASGSVGTYGVQIAKHFGASVTGVCSGNNVEMVKSIGTDFVIDYTKEDFTKDAKEYDLVFDAVDKMPKEKRKSSLKKKGQFISVMKPTTESLDKLEYLNNMIENGEIQTVIDSVFSLDEIVEAYKLADIGHKKGNIVIKVASDK